MPIYIDATESRETSALPAIRGARVSTDLEALTGADILISPLTMPPNTEALVRKHIESKAVLVQRKSSEDLVRSIGTRIPHSLAKMRSTGAAQWQCVLLSTGFFVPDLDTGNIWVGKMAQDLGQPTIIWHSVKWEYRALATELRRYSMRGGTYIPLTCDEEIPGWCLQCEEDLVKLHREGAKELWPDYKDYPADPPLQGDILQELRPVTDGRIILAAFNGVGSVKANALWDAIREKKQQLYPDRPEWQEPELHDALVWATAQDVLIEQLDIPKVKGWGKGTRDKIRQQMGLQDGFDLGYFVNLDESGIREELEKMKQVDGDDDDDTLAHNREILHGDGTGEL